MMTATGGRPSPSSAHGPHVHRTRLIHFISLSLNACKSMQLLCPIGGLGKLRGALGDERR